jgi:hypothetical protein
VVELTVFLWVLMNCTLAKQVGIEVHVCLLGRSGRGLTSMRESTMRTGRLDVAAGFAAQVLACREVEHRVVRGHSIAPRRSPVRWACVRADVLDGVQLALDS